ncbi:MAG TPA: SDR family oxidoreductase [Frateuria sp.]|uniref:SDR family oxidoreductase n=1 Tax=Frateuria sp. TaxID=2211372 RepID=UPI002D8111B8|nr:SDR family oxidoreductase [Frateuria sp.]HET6806981.1 SDR family oxidoreductase [Frateuria sp.]
MLATTGERVLLAGCGDVGLRVARRLRAAGHTVFALRRCPPAEGGDGLHWLAGDLTAPATLGPLPEDITRLVYLPAPGARERAVYEAVFLDGLRGLLERLNRSRLARVLFVSSSAVYGDQDGGWVDEDTPPAPPGFNGAVLLEAERWLATQDVPSTALRLAGLYGPGRLQLIERLRAGRVAVPRERPHWANRIHVEDAAGAIAHLSFLSGARPLYLGVDDTPLPLHVLYDRLASLAGAPLPAEGAPPTGVGSKRLSNARLRASGWSPLWPDARSGYAALLGREP